MLNIADNADADDAGDASEVDGWSFTRSLQIV